MFRKQRCPGVRAWIAAMLLAGSLSAAVADASVVLPDSVKPVEQAPASGPADPHKPLITRNVLKAGESAAPLEFEVALKMRNFRELQARVARGERIPLQEMAARYDPLAADYEAVAAWITSQGLTITRRDGHHMAIFARGKISQVQQALRVRFARVSLEGQEYTSAITAPSVPAALSPLLVGINGLQPHLRAHKHIVRRQDQPNALSGSASYLPKQIAQAYNATALYNTNINGSGQAIAIVIDTFPVPGDLETFWGDAGVSQSISNIQFIQVVAGTLPAPSGEETLDVEWSSAMAPGARVRVYAATDLASADLDQAYLQVYDDATNHPELGIHQMSMSFGEGESYTTNSQVQTDDQYFTKLTGAGVTPFAASGDDGSTPGAGGTGDESGPVQAENPASDPNVTGVGGTTLILNSSNNATSEVVWNANGGASGGGLSEYFPRPSWQTGTGVVSGTNREVPDVASAANPSYGAVIVEGGVEQTVGGTSWGSPTWAGFCALINQARADAGQASLGVLGPHIYPLLDASNYPANYLADFRDITSGNNETRFSRGDYSATAGYDLCTGLGGPLMEPLAQYLIGSSALVGVQTPPAVESVVPGQNATFTVAVSGGSATYQWQRMPVGSSTWSDLSDSGAYSGSATATLAIADATTAMSGDQFQCLVTVGSNTVTTAPPSVLIVDTPLSISALAGQVGTTGLANGTGAAAQFNYPSGVAVDGSGDLYVADYGNNQIREITPVGTVSTPYGALDGDAGSNNGAGNSALFNTPNAVAVDSSYNLYVADTGNNIIRKITGGVVSTLAGTSNGFNSPEGIAVDGTGNVYVADTNNDVIREITPNGTVSVLAGQAGVAGYADGDATTEALFNNPTSVAVDSLGNVYVADFNNSVIRKISSGTVTTPAGQAEDAGYLDGLGANARFNAPIGLAVDSSNNLYIADSLVPAIGSTAAGNNILRKLTPAGVVSTIAGDVGVTGSTNGAAARFYSLQAVAASSSGPLYLADTYNQTIRTGTANGTVSAPSTSIISLSGTLAFGDVTVGGTATSTLTISNTGNAVLSVSSIAYPGGFSGNWASGAIPVGGSQAVTVTFAPAYAISYSGNIVVTSDATSGSNTIATSGTGVVASTLASAISLSGTLAFGDVAVDGTATSTLTISNTGSAVLNVSSIAYPGGFSGNWASGVIPVGGSQGVTVTFVPAYAINYSGNIVVSSDAASGSSSIAVSGMGVAGSPVPAISLSGTLAFGDVAVGGTATSTLTISNNGSATLNVSGIAYPAGFSGNWASGAISAGGSQAVTVAFAPTSAISYGGDIIVSSDAVIGSNTIAISGAGVTTPAAPAVTTTAATGDSAAGVAGAEFSAFDNPAINSLDYLAFQATLATGGGVTASDDSGIWAEDDNGTRGLVARTGGFAPGTGNAVFSKLGNPVYNNNEAVAFLGTLKVENGLVTANTATGIWSNSGGSLALVAREGGQAPGYPTGTTFKSFNAFALPDQRGVIFLATVHTGKRGIWVGSSTANLQLLVKEGDVSNGRTITGLAFLPALPFVNGQTRSFVQGTGNIIYRAAFSGKTTGLIEVAGTTSQLVAQSQESAAGVAGALFSDFGNPALNANDYLAFEGTLTTGFGGVTASNKAGIWADDNTGTLQLVARTGNTAPGSTAVFRTLSDPVYNDNEAVAFRGGLKVAAGQAASTTAAGIWSNTGGSLALVARQGSQAPGCPTGVTFKSFTSLALPDQGGVILLATLNTDSALNVTSASNTGIWAVDTTGSLQLIVRKGGFLNGKTISGLSFLPILSNAGGQSRNFTQAIGDLAYEAIFSDQTSAIVEVSFP